ncbi:MAG: hypothetical protein HY561_01475 [Gemmatimonadetes bacterium]|nr:hypothetical protein [Gemmatimonadota bacterium]
MSKLEYLEMSRDPRPREARRFREIFRRVHARHPACLKDEWLMQPCRAGNGRVARRPIVWSRRNGAWRRVEILWVGAAPGNAGARGAGELGAHGTRIPFGGDVGGGNMDVLLSTAGVSRNETFITAALNTLPAGGGGEPRPAEIGRRVGGYPTSLHLLRDTLVAAGPRLVVALGNVGLRALIAAARLQAERKGARRGGKRTAALPSQRRLEQAGLRRNQPAPWPDAERPDDAFLAAWQKAWGDAPLPHLLWLTHPSAQNMSPYAGTHTAFHTRMRAAQAALRAAVRTALGREPPRARPPFPRAGIYALPEWRDRIRPRHEGLDRLWREKGV